jgi:hypothetical protein
MIDYRNVESFVWDTLKRTRDIPDFSYSGDLPIGESWGFTLGVHRDSDVLSRSNWEVISGDMESRFPDDTEVIHCRHWAVGWYDHLTIRLMDSNGLITEAARAIYDWHCKLSDYPVANEDRFSELEYGEKIESMEESIRVALHCSPYWIGSSNVDSILEHIRINDERSYDRAYDREGWLEDEPVILACYRMGLIEIRDLLDEPEVKRAMIFTEGLGI